MFVDVRPLAQYEADWICDTGAETGRWNYIYATTDTVFTTLTGSYTLHGTKPTLAAGCIIGGIFTAITLASGSVYAYKAGSLPT
jgi:hypothetical protein